MERTARKEHFGCLDALRGLAALWVVFNHLGERLDLVHADTPVIVWTWLIDYGGLGVIVFFAISGYVIAHSLRNTTVDSSSFGNFMARRLVRLTPPYYAALAFALVVNAGSAAIKHDSYAFPSAARMLAHLLYLPDLLNMPMVNGVHWTLYIELQFYATICLVIWAVQHLNARRPALGTAFVAACAAVALTWPVFSLRHGREHYFLPYWYSFLLGVFLYWSRTGRIPRWLLASYVAVLGLAWAIHGDSLVGAAFVTGIFMVVAGEKDRMQRWLRQRVPQFLGKISYSLYITHAPVIGAVYYAGTKVLGTSESTQLLLVVPEVVASIVVGTVAWWLVERPAVRWSKNLRRERTTVPAPLPA